MTLPDARYHYNVLGYFSCVILLVLDLGIAAQPTCQVMGDQVDAFTDSRILQLGASTFSQGPQFEWMAIDDQVYLKIQWVSTEGPAVALEGDPLMLKLENDSVLILTATESVVGKWIEDDHGNRVSKAMYCYGVDHRQLAMISQFWVFRMRIYFNQEFQEFDAAKDPTWQMALWKTANCTSQELSLKPVPAVITGLGGPVGSEN